MNEGIGWPSDSVKPVKNAAKNLAKRRNTAQITSGIDAILLDGRCFGLRIGGGAKRAAPHFSKRSVVDKFQKELPSGAEALIHLAQNSAVGDKSPTYQSCPFKAHRN
jgi:hypothetical protein